MKRPAVLLCLILIPSMCFAAVWFQTQQDTGANATINVFNLADPLFLPIRGTDFYSGTYTSAELKGRQAPGVNSNNNYVGKVVVQSTSKNTTVTIETTGRFVSASDPTKYREFSIAVNPRRSRYVIFSENYYESAGIRDTDRMPNTRSSGSVTITLPSAGGQFSTYYWLDMLVCMDELTSTDLQHLAENDDYHASFTVSWTGGATGSATVNLRGYYGNADGFDLSQDSVYITVIPNSAATNLDLVSMLSSGDSVDIAEVHVYSTPSSTRTDWSNTVYTFPSASPSYNSANQDGFVLVNSRDPSKTIPYTVSIRPENGSGGKTFDGKLAYDGVQGTKNKCITGTYSSAQQSGYYIFKYDGIASIEVQNPQGVNVLENIYDHNTGDGYYGEYESYIYYHVVYDN
ncbi:MAG: hypothetical protein IJ863_01900 [Spirochaetales bacterium]|nr:hypothetical protein [Spirochaetales bacterium]